MDIQLYDKVQNPIEAIDRIGEYFAKSGMFGCDRLEQGKVLAMVCLAERRSPVEITRTYHILDGKLQKKALAALAEFRAHGGRHVWKRTGDEPAAKSEDRKAVGYFKDKDGNEITYEYSLADAEQEKLIRPGSRWEKRPGNMLRARVISNALGMLMPELYAGDDLDTPSSTDVPIMNLGKTAPEPTSEPEPQASPKPEVKQAKVEEVKTVTHQVSEAPAKEPDRGPAPDTADDVSMGNLPDDLVTKLQAALDGCAPKAHAFFLQEGWLQKGQDWSFLTETRAKRILNQTQSFRRRIGAEVVEQKGGEK